MWARIKRLLSNKKIMVRFAFTLVILLVFRIVSYIPVPLYNTAAIDAMFAQSGSFFAILNNFTGQALQRFSILALGISPYITASIVLQLLQMVIPAMKELAETGEAGKAKINRWTRILAVVLAFIQGLALILGISTGPGNVYHARYTGNYTFGYFYMALTIAAGTAFSIWIADMVTKKGIGNGTSLLIVAGIVTSIPTMFSVMWQYYIIDKTNGNWSYVWFIVITLLYFGILLAVVFMESAQRKIPIQYANRQGKSDANIPMKLNSAGVIPVIFASTILSIPMTITGFFTQDVNSGWGYWINQIFGYTNPIGFILYVVLIVVFSFFYSFLQIDPAKISDNLSKANAYIPGVRPGEDTQNFIAKLLFKVTIIGTTYLVILAILPIVTSAIFGLQGGAGQAIILGGTSLLIVVGVAIETAEQLETDAEQDEYKGIFG
ncbi:MAG: preprotein translocase subunit SecY [Acholeplasmataceae bacterium]|jgi:preprotein translocase subunit SecY